jgi:hypothetical protein
LNRVSHSPAKISRLVRQFLAEGKPVAVPGLGEFRTDGVGRVAFAPQARPQVFVAYVVEDAASAERLCAGLESAGFDPWLDRRKLLPGQNWPRAIERAIEVSDGFVACLSTASVSKRSCFQAELRWALDCASRIPLDEIFFIPARLDDCQVPASIQRTTQYIDLFPDWDRGVQRIVNAIRKRPQ